MCNCTIIDGELRIRALNGEMILLAYDAALKPHKTSSSELTSIVLAPKKQMIARKTHCYRCFLLALMVTTSAAFAGIARGDDTPTKFDVVILSGRVVDGTGAPWFQADIGIRDGKIVKIGRIDPEQADETIDATGLVVAPGFVDMMGQTATPMLRDPDTAINLLTQGITTINAGEGSSAAPVSGEAAATTGWQNTAEYFQLLDLKGMPVNVVPDHRPHTGSSLGDGGGKPPRDRRRAGSDEDART